MVYQTRRKIKKESET